MISGWLKQLLIGILALVALTFLYAKAQTVDAPRHMQIFSQLREFKQVNASLKEKLLKSRYGVAHYAGVNRDMARLRRLFASFKRELHALSSYAGAPDIEQSLARLGGLLKRRAPMVEQFESRNAILEESLNDFPFAADRLTAHLSKAGGGPDGALPVIRLLNDTLVYNIHATRGQAARVRDDIAALRDMKQVRFRGLGAALDNVLARANMIVVQESKVDPLLEQIANLPVGKRNNELTDAYSLLHERLVRATYTYRLYLYLFSVLLLAYIGYIMFQLRNSAQALRQTVARLENQKFALDQHSIVTIADVEGNIVYANDKMCEVSGYDRETLIGNSYCMLNADYHDEAFFQDMWGTIRRGEVWHGEVKNRKQSGGVFWVESTIVPFMDEHGSPYQYVAISTDITERRQAEEAVFQAKERAQVTLQSIGDGVITTSAQGIVEYLNPMAEQLTGWTSGEAHGRPLPAICHIVDEASGDVIDNPIATSLSEERIVSAPIHPLLLRRDGTEFAIELTASPIRDRAGGIIGAVIVLHDLTEMRGLARKISYQATHDALTGLVNRHEFERRLEQLLKSAKEHGNQHALCYIDLDQFKVVNDTCGHIAGDELLRQLATLLQAKIRSRDTLARLGGDEFGVLLGDCPLKQARFIADLLCQTVNDFRFVWHDKTFEVGASIGLAAINSHSGTAVELLSAADAACYAAKDKGRNRVYTYTPDDKELKRRQGEMQWVSHIKKAFDDQRFKLYRQRVMPVSERAGKSEYCEILIRMKDHKGRVVLPMAFIPAAERYNLMPAIDRWVIDAVFSLCASLREDEAVAPAVIYAVNVSGTSLGEESFLGYVKERLAIHAVPAESICFEITETAAIANMSKAILFMNELKELGCRFSLDDFGSGLSSFAYLKNLPVDYLKIDGSFVRDMLDDPIDYAMVESINNIGHVMGIETIAESVEDPRLMEALRALKVDYAQGFGIDRPRPLPSARSMAKES